MRKKYDVVVATKARIAKFSSSKKWSWPRDIYITGPGWNLGDEREFPQIKPGMYVQVVYRYSKKPWKD